jgi:capsular exopolysaccharide synthesis family protein
MNDLAFRPLGTDDSQAMPRAANRERTPSSLPLVLQSLRILKRWKWLILAAIGICLLLGFAVTLIMAPRYTASATIEIQREDAQIVKVDDVQPQSSAQDLEFYQTQYGLLKSRSLAERVARELKLQDNPSFFKMFGAKQTAQALNQHSPELSEPAAREERLREAGRILLANVGIDPTQMSQLVNISFTSPDPVLSAQIVNKWSESFIDTTLERKFDATSYARNFLEGRLEQLRQRLEESERLLVKYAAREGIVGVPTTTSDAKGQTTTETPLVAENLAALNSRLNEATAQRMAAQSKLQGGAAASPEALTDTALSGLRERRAELAAEHAKLLTQFEPQYPPVQALANQIAQLDRSIAQEQARVRNTMQQQYQAASAEESKLRTRVNALRSELLDLRGRTIQYNIYQREVDTNRELYNGLLQRYKEIGVAGGVGKNNISIVDPAEVPRAPSSPNLFLNMLIALAAGVLIGAALAIALEQIDEAIADPSDVEPALGFPLLGTAPKAEGEPQAELEDRKSAMAEAYLSIQAALSFTTDHGIPRTIGITSTRPGEGKSTTAFALSQSLTRTGRRVLLVDGDMRSPSLHTFFDLENKAGLSNYLSGEDSLRELIREGLSNGLAVMTAGPQPPNAAELLTGNRLPKMLSELSSVFDHFVFDFPPVMGLADAPLMASRLEGTVFAIESHATRASVARMALDRLVAAQVRVLGVVLTKFQANRAHYGYGYDYGYGYGSKGATASE